MTNLEFSVPCLFGLEGLAGDELKRMGIENVRVENGRVLFSGDERAMVSQCGAAYRRAGADCAGGFHRQKL